MKINKQNIRQCINAIDALNQHEINVMTRYLKLREARRKRFINAQNEAKESIKWPPKDFLKPTNFYDSYRSPLLCKFEPINFMSGV